MIRLDEYTSCLLDEQLACLRQADPACRSLDERQSHLGLESSDLLRQRRLAIPSRCAARVKCDSSATMTRYRRCRSSISRAYRSPSPLVLDFSNERWEAGCSFPPNGPVATFPQPSVTAGRLVRGRLLKALPQAVHRRGRGARSPVGAVR